MYTWLKNRFERTPDPNWIEKQNQEGELTPDWWNISECTQMLYFAYGEDMPDLCLFDGLIGGDAIRYGEAYTAEPLCLFRSTGNHKFAVALEKEIRYNYPPCPLSSIRGELLGLEPETIRELDRYFENGIAFQRKRIWLYKFHINATNLRFNIHDNVEMFERIAAWTYVGRQDYWKDTINNYDHQPVKRQDTICMKNFYDYTQFDLD